MPTYLFTHLLLSLGLLLSLAPTAAPAQALSDAPALSGRTLSAEPFDLSALRGKVVLVLFWSTDCPVCLDKMPEGPVMAKLPKVLKSEVCEVYHPTEAPKGEIGYYLVGEKGSTNPYRFHVRAPGFMNLQSLPAMVEDSLIADIIAGHKQA